MLLLYKCANEQMNKINLTYYNITNVNSVSESNQLLIIQMSSMENWDYHLSKLMKLPHITVPGHIPVSIIPQIKKGTKGLLGNSSYHACWHSNSWLIITTKYSGDIHMCIDLRPLNKEISNQLHEALCNPWCSAKIYAVTKL